MTRLIRIAKTPEDNLQKREGANARTGRGSSKLGSINIVESRVIKRHHIIQMPAGLNILSQSQIACRQHPMRGKERHRVVFMLSHAERFFGEFQRGCHSPLINMNVPETTQNRHELRPVVKLMAQSSGALKYVDNLRRGAPLVGY